LLPAAGHLNQPLKGKMCGENVLHCGCLLVSDIDIGVTIGFLCSQRVEGL